MVLLGVNNEPKADLKSRLLPGKYFAALATGCRALPSAGRFRVVVAGSAEASVTEAEGDFLVAGLVARVSVPYFFTQFVHVARLILQIGGDGVDRGAVGVLIQGDFRRAWTPLNRACWPWCQI